MRLNHLPRGVSLGALTLVVVSPPSHAQEPLPTIEVGAATPARAQNGVQGNDASGPASGAGYGGAGAGQDPFNPSYSQTDESVGTKTDTPVMETPYNVQSVTQQVLKDQQVTDLAKALQNVSGVTITNGPLQNGNPYDNIVIRGFQADYIYRDGFRVDGGAGYGGQQFANVQSVEVLKGAAAALYGLSEPGGTVNIVTKQPLDQPFYEINQQVGSLADYRTTIDATGPLTSDKAWLYRVNMSYENDLGPYGSIIQNTRAQYFFIAPVVKWNIDQDNWIKIEALYSQGQGSFGNFTVVPEINGTFVNTPRWLNFNESNAGYNDTMFAALTYQHNFDKDWFIKQMIAYNRTESYGTLQNGTFLDLGWPTPSYDRTYDFNEYMGETFSTNVDITGHVDMDSTQHTLLMGGDFYKTLNWSRYYQNNSWISPISIVDPIHPGLPFLLPLGSYGEFRSPQDTAGLYVQDQIKLPYDLFFMGGARYQYFRENGGSSDDPSTAVNLASLGTPPYHGDAQQFVTPRFGLLWRPYPWASGYVSYAEGFSSNGGSYVYPNTPVAPTSARDAEVGLKFQFFEDKLQGTIGYYDLTRTNQTEPDLNPNHVCIGNGGSFPTCKIILGDSRTKGPEVDIRGTFYPGLNLILNYTNISSALIRSYAADTSNSLGQPFPGAPRNLANASVTYEVQDGALQGLKLGASYNYHGAQRVVDQTGYNLGWLTPSLAGYGTVDLLAEYPFEYGGWKYKAGFNIHNLFDRTYYTSEYLQAPLVGLASAYDAGRSIGDNFSVMGHLTAQFPGSPPPPNRKPEPAMTWAHDWSGPYAGLQVGAAWGDNDGKFSYATPDGLMDSPSLVTTARGVLAGAHVGYNQQFDHWVLGLEGSGGVSNLEKKEVLGVDNPNPALYYVVPVGDNVYCNANFCGGSINTHITSNVQGSLRARAGYAWNRLLLYGTGGLAFSNINVQSNIGGEDVNGNYYFAAAKDRSLLQLGWTLGAGVEYAITPRWSARAEWRYSDFGSIIEAPTIFSASPDGTAFYQGKRRLTQDQLELGFSYKFGGADPDMFPLVSPPVFKGPALAGELPSLKGGPVPPTSSAAYEANWSGFYLGGQAGYAYGDNHGSYNFSSPDGILSSGALAHDAQGVLFGAHVGYNRQFDNWVVGFEGSVDGTSLVQRESLSGVDAAGDQAALSSFVQSDIQGSVRARAGYSIGRLLPYVAGGLAIGHFATQSDLASAKNADSAFDGFATHGLQWTTRLGWTLGGGLEWAVNNHWSIRGEYRYSDFGVVADAPTVALPGTFYGGERRLDQNQVQFGFSYKFGDPLLVPVAQPALAAQAKELPIDWGGYTWTGLYAGGQLGYLWGANHGLYYAATNGGLAGWDQLTGDLHNITVEGHVGYNKQFDNIVVGLEGSVDGGNAVRNSLLPVYDGNGYFGPAAPGGQLTTAIQSTIEGSVRARVGYAFGRLLPFVSGGVALGGFSQRSYLAGQDAVGFFNAASAGQSMLRVGWSVGAGAEWAFTRNLALRGEYRYTDYGSVSEASTSAAGAAFVGTRRLDQNQLLFGVSYKFTDEGPGAGAVAASGLGLDLPRFKDAPTVVPTAASWRGFYAGVNLGGAWDAKAGQTGFSSYYDPTIPFGSSAAGAPNLLYLPNGATATKDGGVLGGGQVGYNFQIGQSFVVGAEADIAATSLSGGNRQNGAAYPSPFAAGGVVVPAAPLAAAQENMPYLGTLRGRAGYLVTPTLLLHATAGFAYDGVDAWAIANTRTGWAAGVGAEWMFVPSWSAKVEYLYADISGGEVSTGSSWNYGASFHPQINILRGGVNYHFSWFAPGAISAKY